MTRYKVNYGWQTYETTRCEPGVLTHALMIDDTKARSVHVEWCGSYEIAAREKARVIALKRPGIGAAICDVLEAS